MRNKKFGKILVSSILVIACAGVITVGAFWAARIIKKSGPSDTLYGTTDHEWDEIPADIRKFSEFNSFRVCFTTDPQHMSQGTAWSFYLNPNAHNGMVEWYLGTNFHVVNEAVYYNGGENTELNAPTFYKHKVDITKGFLIQQYEQDPVQQRGYYRSIMDGQGWNRNTHVLNTIRPEGYTPFFGRAQRVEVITDNAQIPYNQDNLNLFSNRITPDQSKENNFYNLDMAFIKLTFNKDYYNNDVEFFKQIANPYKKWRDSTEYEKHKALDIRQDKGFYMAGNPAFNPEVAPWGAHLVPAPIHYRLRNTWSLETRYMSLNQTQRDTVPQRALAALNEKSWRPKEPYADWRLTSGASGSAVYQTPIIDYMNGISGKIDPKDVIPVGIFWGGLSVGSQGAFIPCFIPFVTEQYNIFENFTEFLKKEANLTM